MGKRWLLRFLAGLLTASLCSVIITTVLNQTVLNSHYLENHIAAINGYSRLSSDISGEVAKQAGLTNIPGATNALQGIITPDAMKQKVNSALEGMQAYEQGKGSAPSINLSDLASQAQAAGLPLGQAGDLFQQPVTLGPQNSGKGHPALNLSGVRTATLITTVLLAVLVGLLSWQWRRYGTLPNVLIGVGLLMLMVAALTYVGPGELSRYLKFTSGSYAFAILGRDLVQNIARDVAHRFAVIAAVCLVTGIIARIVVARLQTKVSEDAVLSNARTFAATRK